MAFLLLDESVQQQYIEVPGMLSGHVANVAAGKQVYTVNPPVKDFVSVESKDTA